VPTGKVFSGMSRKVMAIIHFKGVQFKDSKMFQNTIYHLQVSILFPEVFMFEKIMGKICQ